MFTIGQLANEFEISRSTLLYYDRIGLLTPSGRSASNYRLYSPADRERLVSIRTYREAGLDLDSISAILTTSSSKTTRILEQRLATLNTEISRLREQQAMVVKLLGDDSLLRSVKIMTKQQWVDILTASGMDQAAQRQWHIEFEKNLPEAHTDFLQSLGIEPSEIEKIKAWSRGALQK